MLPVTSMPKTMSTAYCSPLTAAGAWPGATASAGELLSCSVMVASVLAWERLGCGCGQGGRWPGGGWTVTAPTRVAGLDRAGAARGWRARTARPGLHRVGTTGRGLGPAH